MNAIGDAGQFASICGYEWYCLTIVTSPASFFSDQLQSDSIGIDPYTERCRDKLRRCSQIEGAPGVFSG